MKRIVVIGVMVLLGLAAGIGVRAADEGKKLVGYWKFNEGKGEEAKDSSDNGNDGTIVGEAVWVPGKIGSSLQFNGIDQYVKIPNSDSLNPTDQITISAWVKPTDFEGMHCEILRQDSSAKRKLFCFQYKGTRLTLGLNTGGLYWETGFPVDPKYFTDGKWHLVTYTYDGSEVKLYVDGKLNNSLKRSGQIAEESVDLFIACWSGVNEFFKGGIDEVAIYNYALSYDEVKKLYDAPITPQKNK